jgi:hypothetical protein
VLVVQLAGTLSGVKLQVVLIGSPLQERLTKELNPFTGVTVMTMFTKPPTGVDRDVGVATTVNPATVDALACTTSGVELEVS